MKGYLSVREISYKWNVSERCMEMLSMLLKIWRSEQQSILFVTHEIDEALTVASRIAVLSARPARIRKIIELPGQEGRDCAAPELTEIRRDVLRMISTAS